MKSFDDIGVQIPLVYLPKTGTNLTKWAVIACDQFTSQPEYWQKVEDMVGSYPSTLRLVLPEVYLEKPGEAERIERIQASMRTYLDTGILEQREGLVYVEREVGGKTRRGLLLCLDLECYDFTKGSSSLIRATEGTIIERLPPRMKIREGAALELPHIMVLIDDPQRTVIEPLAAEKAGLPKLYDFELMLGSGHLRGFGLDEELEKNVVNCLRELANPELFSSKYAVGIDTPVLLFAMGDGNHSLATAKAVWEKIKLQVGPDHPARYALVEIENIHDEGLQFEPIHRVLFGLNTGIILAMQGYFGGNLSRMRVASPDEMIERVSKSEGKEQTIGVILGEDEVTYHVIEITNPSTNLPVGTLQEFIDHFLKENGAERIDYVHGDDTVLKLGAQKGNAGFLLPGMKKSDLFKTVILDGALPRKTFSMGEAKEKKFYMESRRIA